MALPSFLQEFDFNLLKDFFSKAGEQMAKITSSIIKWLSSLGLEIGSTQGKWINLALYLGLLYILLKFVTIARKPIKYLLILILCFLVISTILSLF